MFFCIDSENHLHKGKTLTEAFKKAENVGGIYANEDCIFIEGEEVKVNFLVVPSTVVKTVAKKPTTKKVSK